MIKKLRRKFIFIATLSVGITLFLIVGIINYTNYHRIDKNSDYILDILKDNNGNLPSSLPPNHSFPNFTITITKETPFETRYFTVILNEQKEVIFTNTSKIASINEKQTINYTLKLVSKNKTSGYYHKFKYTTLNYDARTMYIFLDYSLSINTFYNIFIYSLIISLLGLILVFILVLILSKFLLKPAEESYQKQKVFITNASHDIKTPLTIINADTEVIEMENGFHNKLFERFYRNDKSRNSENGGNGIGLSVVKSIIEVHKWKINCICIENKKIQFIINI